MDESKEKSENNWESMKSQIEVVSDQNKQSTKVSLVGAGPGNPDLLTIRGLRKIQEAEVILYDALLDPSFLEIFPKDALILYVGKRSGQHSATQEEINDLLVNHAKLGKRVVRLKGGDPFIFGRAGEEILALAEHGIEFEIIPGVSSVQAGAADGLIPLTHRAVSRQLFVMDGHTIFRDGTDWNWLSHFPGTLAILMGTKNIQAIARHLIANGMKSDTAVAMVVDASLKSSKTLFSNLQEIAESGLNKDSAGPGIIYIGESIRISRDLHLTQDQNAARSSC